MSTRLDRSTRTLTTEPRRGAQELRRAQGWGGHERRRAVSQPGLPPRARARGGTAKAFRPRAHRSSCPPLQGSVMSVLVDRNSRVVIQGITGRAGSFHTAQMRAFGTKIVAGVSPGKGATDQDGVPIFDTVADAVAATGADVS